MTQRVILEDTSVFRVILDPIESEEVVMTGIGIGIRNSLSGFLTTSLASKLASMGATHWYDTKDLTGTGLSLDDTLPNRINPSGPTFQFGSTGTADTSDGLRPVWSGEDYVFVPGGAGNVIGPNPQFTNAASWSSKIVGKVRHTPTQAGRPLIVGYQSFFDVEASGNTYRLAYRTTGGSYLSVATTTNPLGGIRVQQDVGFEINLTEIRIYARVPTGRLRDQPADSWAGWTLLRTASVTAVPAPQAASFIGSNGGINSFTACPIYEAVMKIDAEEKFFDPSDLTNWTIGRSTTGYTTAVVRRSTWLLDGVDDTGVGPVGLLDVDESATIMAVGTVYDRGSSSFPGMLGTRNSISVGTPGTQGWMIRPNYTPGVGVGLSVVVDDGVAVASSVTPLSNFPFGQRLVYVLRIDGPGRTIQASLVSASAVTHGVAASTAALGSVENGTATAFSRTMPWRGETFMPMMSFDTVLSDAEIIAISAQLISGAYA